MTDDFQEVYSQQPTKEPEFLLETNDPKQEDFSQSNQESLYDIGPNNETIDEGMEEVEGEGEGEEEGIDEDFNIVLNEPQPNGSTPSSTPSISVPFRKPFSRTLSNNSMNPSPKQLSSKTTPNASLLSATSQKSIFDLDIDSFEDKPWEKAGADITDYFNYGFTEETWKAYCQKQIQLRLENSMQGKIKVYESKTDTKKETPTTLNLTSSQDKPYTNKPKEKLMNKPQNKQINYENRINLNQPPTPISNQTQNPNLNISSTPSIPLNPPLSNLNISSTPNLPLNPPLLPGHPNLPFLLKPPMMPQDKMMPYPPFPGFLPPFMPLYERGTPPLRRPKPLHNLNTEREEYKSSKGDEDRYRSSNDANRRNSPERRPPNSSRHRDERDHNRDSSGSHKRSASHNHKKEEPESDRSKKRRYD